MFLGGGGEDTVMGVTSGVLGGVICNDDSSDTGDPREDGDLVVVVSSEDLSVDRMGDAIVVAAEDTRSTGTVMTFLNAIK